MDKESFFEHGFVKLAMSDFKSQQLAIDICMPCCIFQTLTPHFLKNGELDDFRLHDPLAIWLPKLTDERYKEEVRVPNIADRINVALKEEAIRPSKLFIHLQDYLLDPTDIIPILPLGVYIEFTYRMYVDSILPLISAINEISVIGVPEFQWSLATILKNVLLDFEKVNTSKRLKQR